MPCHAGNTCSSGGTQPLLMVLRMHASGFCMQQSLMLWNNICYKAHSTCCYGLQQSLNSALPFAIYALLHLPWASFSQSDCTASECPSYCRSYVLFNVDLMFLLMLFVVSLSLSTACLAPCLQVCPPSTISSNSTHSFHSTESARQAEAWEQERAARAAGQAKVQAVGMAALLARLALEDGGCSSRAVRMQVSIKSVCIVDLHACM